MDRRRLTSLVLLLWASTARATPPKLVAELSLSASPDGPRGSVRVFAEECTLLVVGKAIVAQLLVELRSDGVREVTEGAFGESSPRIADVTLSAEPCSSDASTLRIVVDDHATQKKLERSISLSEVVPSTRTRVAAMAVGELLRASWVEMETLSPPPPRVPVPPALREAVRARIGRALPQAAEPLTPGEPPHVLHAWNVGAAGTVRSYGDAPMMGGGRLVFRRPLGHAWVWRVDLGAAMATRDDALGNIRFRHVSTGASLLYAARSESMFLGPRFELGGAWVSGEALVPQIAARRAFGLQPTVSVLALFPFPVSRALSVNLELELGASFVGFEAFSAERSTATFAGPFVGISFGVGVGPPLTVSPVRNRVPPSQ